MAVRSMLLVCGAATVLVSITIGLVARWSGGEPVAHEAYAVVCPSIAGAAAYAQALPDHGKAESIEKARGCGFLQGTGSIYVEERAFTGGRPYYCLRHESEEQCRWKREITGTPEGAPG